MTTGKKIVLAGLTFPNPKLVLVDPVESSGSLVLYEYGHPANPVVGLPANGATIPNLFSAQSTIMAGNAGNGIMSVVDYSAGKGLYERSTKGGLHYIVSRTLGNTFMGMGIKAADAILTYLRVTFPNHHYYVSLWSRMTRREVSSANNCLFSLTANGSPSSNYLAYLLEGGQIYSAAGGAGSGASLSSIPRALGPQRGAGHFTGWTGTPPASNASMSSHMILGQGGGVFVGNGVNAATWMHYRFYLEDLTVSGRSHTAVDAIESIEYTKQVLTAGGRYYGDTFTDPATVT